MIRQAAGILGLALAVFPGQVEKSTNKLSQDVSRTERPASADLHSIMKKKLVTSQKILEGIALEDFKKIQSSGEELMALSKETEWRVLRTPEYELQTGSFRRAAQDLVKSAEARNVDGAALAYVELTMTCVRCHKYVRDTRRTQVRPSTNPTFALLAK
jgi:hypothetical protein